MATMNDYAGLYEQVLRYSKSIGPYQALALPWWVKVPWKTYVPRHRCEIEPMNCGEKVFGEIANDVQNAQRSVDIITWGFDPGMALVRDGDGHGIRYGDLLIAVDSRKENPVTVRLVLWHDDFFSQMKMKNTPGLYGKRFPSVGSGFTAYYNVEHEKYNGQWFDDVRSGKYPNIHLRVRSVPSQLFGQALKDEDAPGNVTSAMGKIYATHHQKMLLVDYEMPKRAIGYVMGHNSVTDFWDTPDHVFRSPRRETMFREDPSSTSTLSDSDRNRIAGSRWTAADFIKHQQDIFRNHHGFTAKPYQDVSTRLRGPILYDLNHNFCQAWTESCEPAGIIMDLLAPVRALLKHAPHGLPGTEAAGVIAAAKPVAPEAFIDARAKLKSDHFLCVSGRHSVQLLRTQPMHGEKSIKECYANLTRQVHHYIFIQNQYVQYKAWAEHFNECVGRLRMNGYTEEINVFILTSTPESDGMDLLAYDVVKELGLSSTMVVEHEAAVADAHKNGTAEPIGADEFSRGGVNVFMGSLWTCAGNPMRAKDYEEIYIHAKVAIVDDAALTIGSANLNIRSMAFDSELNILSDACDVAYALRRELFKSAAGDPGPPRFADMSRACGDWNSLATMNVLRKASRMPLLNQLLPYYVDRKPGKPVI